MHHQTRLILFSLFVILFLAIGTATFLYSHGWRIDFDTMTVQKIGAIYIKTNLRDTTIKLNGKQYRDESGILQSGTLISNLLPKSYRVEITKEGYQRYQKTLVVQPSRVEELLNVQLIPEKIQSSHISATKGTDIIDIAQAGDKIIIQDEKSGIYYLHDKANASSTLNLTMAVSNTQKGQKIKKIMFVPFKSTLFVIEDSTGLKLFDLEKRTIESLIQGALTTWSMRDSTILLTQKTKTRSQEVTLLNLIFKTKTLVSDVNVQVATTTTITTIAATSGSNAIAFSDAKNTLFLFSQKTKTVQRIADNVLSFSFSPDNKKLMVLANDGGLSILFIEEFNGDIRKKEGDWIKITLANNEPIKTVAWYNDSYHILLEHSATLSIAELDDRKPVNIFSMLSDYMDYHYALGNNSVYFIDKQGINMFRIEK